MGITADYAKGSSGAPVITEFGTVAGMVSTTRPVHTRPHAPANGEKPKEGHVQMVLKNCVPAAAILKLIDE